MKNLFASTLILTLLVQFSVAASGPQPLAGQLTDGQQQPLAYASIGVIDSPVGTVADAQGRFTLYLTEKVNQTDIVLISLIGYRPLRFSVADFGAALNAGAPLVMEEEVVQLGEVVVRAKDSRVKTLGKTGYETAMTTNFALSELPRQNLGAEIGRKFNVSKGDNYLETYKFYLISNFDSTRFRINVYRAKNMKNLLPQNLYITVPGQARQWVEVDLTPYRIITSDDVIISVQWVDSFGEGTALQMPIQMPATSTHYYRYGSQDRWRKFRGMTTAMNLTFTRSRGSSEPQSY